MAKKNILIVDDEKHILKMLKKALTNEETEVITASKLESAEKLLETSTFDLVIADIRLTGVLGREGLQLLDYIKQKHFETEVIIMTGYGSSEIEMEAYERGAFFYFDKPVDLRIIKEQISELGIK